jgi:predicted nucleic acid-binding protein
MLTDAGPLIALFDRRDPDHLACADVVRETSTSLQSTWPAFAEAMFLLGERFRRTRWSVQKKLWGLLATGALMLRDLTPDEIQRSCELMQKYHDLPMDLADATLVALAESTGTERIFTLDRDFRVYRLHGRKAFDIVPKPTTAFARRSDR